MQTQTINEKKYAKLLLNVLPRPITTDVEHKALLSVTSSLMEKEQITPEETALLLLLSGLISDYEKRRFVDASEEYTSAEVLSFLMKENRLTQKDFPSVPQSRISDILTGKRKISKEQAKFFGERFNVNPAIFLFDVSPGKRPTERRVVRPSTVRKGVASKKLQP